jgi:hypothetical protein
MRLTLKRQLTVLAVIAAGLAAGGIAYASVPDASGVIHGCYQKVNGQLRVIDSSTDNCGPSEVALNWNQTGPQGPSGVTTVWSEYAYPARNFYSPDGGELARLTFTSPSDGFVVVTANFATRIHNATGNDCRVQTQIAPAAGVPDQTAPGFVDQWINENLPTQLDAGTYLGLNASGTRVLPAVTGSNTVYLNGKSDCTAVLLGPVTMTAVLAQNNPTATLVTP